jgi:hypothetical protein
MFVEIGRLLFPRRDRFEVPATQDVGGARNKSLFASFS